MLLKIILLSGVMMSLTFDAPKQVGVEVEPPSTAVENRKPFTFLIMLKPIESVHINAEPQVSIKSGTQGASLTVKEIHKSGDYLDSSKPIRIECKLSGMKPGLQKVKFELTYTYCSETEGWCRMSKDSSSIELRVKR